MDHPGSPEPTFCVQGRFDTTGVFSDTLSWNRGKHTIKAGGEFRRFIGSSFTQTAGVLTFNVTEAPPASPGSSQPPPPNFIDGIATSFNVTPTQVTSRIFENAARAFLSDNYKVTPRFQAEVGFRFEWNGTPTEGGGRLVNFDTNTNTLVHVTEAYNQNYNYEPRWDSFTTCAATAPRSCAPVTASWRTSRQAVS